MIDRHFLQIQIITSLLFKKESSYTDLKPNDIPNNTFTFHLKSVQKDKLVLKNQNDLYELTELGKEIGNRYESETSRVKAQGKISIIFCPVRNIDSKDPEILLYTRKKHPFYGSQGSPSGKVSYGETIARAAIRELFEETGLTGSPEIFRIEHHRVFSESEGKLLEDKYFYFNRFIEPTGKLKPNNEGDFEWIKFSEISKFVTKPFETLERVLFIQDKVLNFDGKLEFEEIDHITKDF